MNELALFAGAGGGILGGHLLGWRTVCAVEWDAYAASVLCARQNDGLLPPFPIWDDVQTFDGKPWRGRVDVISGGFPCQDISAAGKGAGITGERSGMWFHMARIVGEVRPEYVFVENSPMLTSRGLGTVLGDLASLGYDARWGVLGAADVGAPHQRDRIWIFATNANSKPDGKQYKYAEKQHNNHRAHKIVADSYGVRELQPQRSECDKWGRVGDSGSEMANANSQRFKKQHSASITGSSRQSAWCASEIGSESWWSIEPDVGRVANGVAARVDRLKAIGNGQVPEVAATAWRILNAS